MFKAKNIYHFSYSADYQNPKNLLKQIEILFLEYVC